MSEFSDMDADTLRQALELVRRHTGVTMAPAKRSMLQTRLRQRMRALKLDSYEAYLQRVDQDESEWQSFIDVVTTHHTSFFRTPRIWRYLREEFMPGWLERHPGEALRVWSAAVSSGEEACSIAILLEELRREGANFAYEIVGTDIAASVVAQAEQGVYEGTTATAFRAAYPELYDRYNALGSPDRFQLPAEMRKRISFSTHNLLEPHPYNGRFDLVFLRNVLIYFRKADIEAIVCNVAPALRRDGLLIIGEAESLTAMKVPVRFVRPQIYRLDAS